MAPFVKTPDIQKPKAISMPDAEDPVTLAKKRAELAAEAASGGRSGTILSGNATGASDYNGTVLGN